MAQRSDITPDGPAEKEKLKKYKFNVDNKHLETTEPILTGAQIKSLAQVDPGFGLNLVGHDQTSDRQIADHEQVDLSKPGREKFYTVPPTIFGVQ